MRRSVASMGRLVAGTSARVRVRNGVELTREAVSVRIYTRACLLRMIRASDLRFDLRTGEAYDGDIKSGGSRCPVELLRDEGASTELKTRTDAAEARRETHEVTHGKGRTVEADGRHCKILIAFELGQAGQVKRTPWSVRNIRDALPEVEALALAQHEAADDEARRCAFFKSIGESEYLKRTRIGVAPIAGAGSRDAMNWIDLSKSTEEIKRAAITAFRSALEAHAAWLEEEPTKDEKNKKGPRVRAEELHR